MVISDTVLEIIAKKGPVIPANVAKEIGQNLLMSGAVLSELSSRGKVKVSAVKVGGSPLYYIPGQEEMLLNYIGNLDKNEQRTVERLKGQGVIRESHSDPLTRYTLKVIRDFAIPLTVRVEGASEIFYKWFLLNDDDAEMKIREMLIGKTQPAAQETQNSETQTIKEEANPVKLAQGSIPIEEHIKNGGTQKETQAELSKPETHDTKPKSKKENPPVKIDDVESEKEIKSEKPQNSKEEQPKHKPETKADFALALSQFFIAEKIVVEKETVIKKNTDHEYILFVPSPVGAVTFYCQAKNKKKVTESDLSTLLVKAQYHKLPGLMITSGEITKKAIEMLPNELKGIIIKTLE